MSVLVDHRIANAAQRIITLVGMDAPTAVIGEARRLEGDFFTLEPGVR